MQKSDLILFLTRVRNKAILLVLAATLLLTPPLSERYGDNLQIALPLLGLGCSVLTGGAGEYLLRFVVLEVGIHGPKTALGTAEINARPGGGYKGFPSGHTAAATFGASALVHNCISNSPVTKAVVIIGAGFTGASRIEAEKHNIWQVLAGVLLGWGCERLLRRNTPARRRVQQALAVVWRRLRGQKSVE